MSGKKRVLLLVLIMAFACMVSTLTAIFMLYRAAFEEKKGVLISIANEHVGLIKELAGSDVKPDGSISKEAEDILLENINRAHRHFEGINKTGEFTLAKRVGNRIVFLLDQHYRETKQVPINIKSNVAEPMQLALSGHSGAIVGLDYRGVKVLAAYAPVPGLDWGVVAKMDLAALRAPFAHAGRLSMACSSILVLLGALVFIRITNPIIARLKENSRHLKNLVESLQKSEEGLIRARGELETRVEERTANLVEANKLLELEVRERTRAEERLRALWTIAEKVGAEVDELCDHVVQSTLQMTHSRYAFYGFLNPDESLMRIHSWSENVQEDCQMATKPIEHTVAGAGVWAEAIRQRRVIVLNDYNADSPGKTGIPEGHVRLTRILSVPVFNHNRIVSIVVAANKDTDYDNDDVKQIETFVRGVQSIMDQRKIENALRSSEMECRQLSYQVIEAQEKERKRLAREFHDGIGQSLAALKYRAEGYVRRAGSLPPEDIQELKACVQMIREAMEEVRAIQNDLHPAYLDMIGLLETMSDFCEKFKEIYGNIQIPLQIDISEQELPEYLKVPIFRIFQEAMNNAAKHSHADQILVNIRREADRIELTIKDNGSGFELENGMSSNGQDKGLGLFSMRERAELSGGSLKISTAPGKGTLVFASWPLVATQPS